MKKVPLATMAANLSGFKTVVYTVVKKNAGPRTRGARGPHPKGDFLDDNP